MSMDYLCANKIFWTNPNGLSKLNFLSRQLTLCHSPKSRHSMDHNTAQTINNMQLQDHIAKTKSKHTKAKSTKHQTHAHIDIWTNGTHSCRSQNSHHMESPSFYHTVVHVNDSVNEMLKTQILHDIAWVGLSLTLPAASARSRSGWVCEAKGLLDWLYVIRKSVQHTFWNSGCTAAE